MMKKLRWLILSSLMVFTLVACPTAPDTTPPTVTITTPSDNSSVTTTSVTVTGTASDDMAISSLEYTLNGGVAQSITVANPFSFAVTNLVAGKNLISVTARDAIGNATSTTLNIQQTQTSPTEAEPNDTPIQAQTIVTNSKITGSISNKADIDNYKISVDAGDWIKLDLDAESLTPKSPLDSVVKILNTNGVVLVVNDETSTWSTYSSDPFIAHKFAVKGEYIIQVTSWASGSQGAYTLTVQNKAPAWNLRSIGGSYREVKTTRTAAARVSLELRDADNPDYGPSGIFPVSITGPSNWNNNQVYTTNNTWFGDYLIYYPPSAPDITQTNATSINPRQISAKNTTALLATPLAVGMYTVKLKIYDLEYTSTFSVDPVNALSVPEPVILSNISMSTVTASWSAITGAVRYFTALRDPYNNELIASKSTTVPEAVFTGLTLIKTKQYRVDVNAYRNNGIEEAFLTNISFDQSANRNTFFTPASTGTSFALNISKTGTGTGIIVSSPGGVYCGAVCNTIFNVGTSVTLTAAPTPGSSFVGWSGACIGNLTCTLTMDAAKNVTAAFTTNSESTALGDNPIISGKIDAYSLGAGVIKLRTGGNGSNGNFVATGSVSATGDFSVQLPGASVMIAYLAPPSSGGTNGCASGQTGNITTTPLNFRSAILFSGIFSSNSSTTLLGNLLFTTSPYSNAYPYTLKAILHIFVDQDSIAIGTCSQVGLTQSTDVNLKRGWNAVLFTKTFQSPTDSTSSTTTELPSSDMTWRTLGAGYTPFSVPTNPGRN